MSTEYYKIFRYDDSSIKYIIGINDIKLNYDVAPLLYRFLMMNNEIKNNEELVVLQIQPSIRAIATVIEECTGNEIKLSQYSSKKINTIIITDERKVLYSEKEIPMEITRITGILMGILFTEQLIELSYNAKENAFEYEIVPGAETYRSFCDH